MPEPDPKPQAGQTAEADQKETIAAEIRLLAAYWAEIQAEMNRLLAQEED